MLTFDFYIDEIINREKSLYSKINVNCNAILIYVPCFIKHR